MNLKQHQERVFHLALQQAPHDNLLRLKFADWLDEHSDPRGELLRLTNTLTQTIDIPNRSEVEIRMMSLVEQGVPPVGPYFVSSIGIKFVWIPAGRFLMGSPETDMKRSELEVLHRVQLTRGFFMGIYPITQKQWTALMDTNTSNHKGDRSLPVDSVVWDRCLKFIKKCSEKDGKPYRLPTEAEWEYACRAGTTTPFHFGQGLTTDQANFCPYLEAANRFERNGIDFKDLYRKKTTPVGLFPENAFGVHDMHGNVWEYCSDWYGPYDPVDAVDPTGLHQADSKVIRGGSWNSIPGQCRSATRNSILPRYGSHWEVGFRICFFPEPQQT